MSDADKDFVVGLLLDEQQNAPSSPGSHIATTNVGLRINMVKSGGPEIHSARPVADPLALRPGTSPAAKLSRHLVNTLHGFNKWTSVNNSSTAAIRNGPAFKDINKFQNSDRHLLNDQWGFSRKGWPGDDNNRFSQTQPTQRSSGGMSPTSPVSDR